LKKIPTFFVDKSKKVGSSILYIGKGYCKDAPIHVDFFVNNCSTKQNLKKNILKICKI